MYGVSAYPMLMQLRCQFNVGIGEPIFGIAPALPMVTGNDASQTRGNVWKTL